MRLKSVVKYYLSDIKTSVMIFYIIMAVGVSMIGIIVNVSAGEGESYSGGGEMAAMIFLFIAGLNSFKQNFLFLSINSIPRKLQFKGFLLAALTVCGAMAAIDTAYSNIFSMFFDYRSTFLQIYGSWAAVTSGAVVILVTFLWDITIYLSAYIGGYLITSLYYRMSKLTKIAVSIGVPVWFTIVLPIIDATVTEGRIFKYIGNVFLIFGGLKYGVNPYIPVLSLTVEAAVVAVLCFMLVKTATVKE
ncbi:hypothetical protein [Ruminiclostridium cellobioparum]|uniref:ABC-2 family transporter protein n=1 Tax=Ruminiclostridium cellobioparum subsp. termitidis CT1112 TaxID=1195236 RepID=S0FQV1_RUMCE|nr:hypothetical protein [Ruminiclostridium cellobioparum]EMS74217.1 hypothetical protein CTER_0063 [Ruminiclostridium cellobioparum subsp. termitidis CT1112]